MFRNSLKMLLTGGKANRKSRGSDGGTEEPGDPRSPLDHPLSHAGQGGSIDSDCAFDGDYGVPPLSMTEGMQHIRIMEGVSRSLPSSPLLAHQAVNVRLQPAKKITGRTSPQDAAVMMECLPLHRQAHGSYITGKGSLLRRLVLSKL
ncbi:unnamed protein product [Boreogadus saida]